MDGATDNQLSVAERTHQLRVIARRVIRNCRRIIFLMPKDVMPETIAICRLIRDAWMGKEAGKKYAYEININVIGSILQNDCDHPGLSKDIQQQVRQTRKNSLDKDEGACRKVAKELEDFHTDLEICVEKEFPTYAFERSKKIWQFWKN